MSEVSLFCVFALLLKVNRGFLAFFSFTLANGEHSFCGLGKSPEDEGDRQDKKYCGVHVKLLKWGKPLLIFYTTIIPRNYI